MEEELTLKFNNIEIKIPKSVIEKFLTYTPREEWNSLFVEAIENMIEEYQEKKVKDFFARQSACVKGKENVEPRTKSLIEIVREVKRHSNRYAQDGK